MIIVENLMIIFSVIMVLGAILMFGLSDDGGEVIGIIGGITFAVSILALLFLFGYSDSLEAKMRVNIAKHEDAIFEQIDVIKELECDENNNEFKKEINKLRKYIRDYNSSVRNYTEEVTRPKQFCFYLYDNGQLVTHGTNRDLR